MTAPFFLRFRKIAEAYPEHTAILTDGTKAVTYAALKERSEALAGRLHQSGIGPGSLVALAIEKSAEYIVAMLACWACGAAFVPLDPGLPPRRREAMLSRARPAALLDASLDLTPMKLPASFPMTLAYLIFTSGSSGEPKGVMVPHDGILSFLDAQIEMFALDAKARSLFLLSTQFDASISDIGTALLSGATLCIESTDHFHTAEILPKILHERAITHMDISPALLSLLSIDAMPPTLSTIMIGGEVCSPETIRAWAARYRLIAIYGPTEATVCSSMVRCTAHWHQPSIGQPIEGVTYRVLTPEGLDATGHESGELLIGGQGVALGYVDDPKRTAEKFIFLDSERYYRTGDRVRKEGEEYIFLGRQDRQIKRRGQLIAPEEIEATLIRHPAISRAAVLAGGIVDDRLVAFIEIDHEMAPADIMQWLRLHLPEWMVPNRFIQQAVLPVTLSGKIDYAVLENELPKEISPAGAAVVDERMAALQTIWQSLLRLTAPPDIAADFFADLGGDSLAALAAVFEAERQGLALSSEAIYRYRNIERIVSESPLLLIPPQGLSTQMLEDDARPSSELQSLLRHALSLPMASGSRVFLTGITGFLGAHLAAELLRQTEFSLDCLIRAEDALSAEIRLDAAFALYGIMLTADQRCRLHPVLGDLTRTKFGLDEAAWDSLAQGVSHIYHCAACVHVLKPYEELYAANVDAVHEIVRLACTGSRKHVHHASTLSVFVAGEPLVACCREDALPLNAVIHGGYAQSKWVADRFLHLCREEGLEVSIFRFGLLTGHSVTAIASPRDHFSLFLKGMRSLRVMPDGPLEMLEMDVTPVDYAARAMLHVSRHAPGATYHVAGASRFALRAIAEQIESQGQTLALLDTEAWAKYTPRTPDALTAWSAMCRLLPDALFPFWRHMDLFQATGTVFDQTHLRHALQGSGIACPPADSALLRRYMEAAQHA